MPVYRDAQGDVEHRNYDGVRPGIHYMDTTGRNDIIETRVARDNSHIYFYVKTADRLTAYSDRNWMLLFIDADHDKRTGWNGYDYVVNSGVIDGQMTTLKKWQYGRWVMAGKVPYRVAGNEMELALPANWLHIDPVSAIFNFHWADNIQKLNDISEFFLHGESAPERRFDYHYTSIKEK